MRSGHGITSMEFNAEEFADGDDLTAAAAFTTETYVSAPPVARATSPLAQEALLATRTFVNRLGNQPVFTPQTFGDSSECGGIHLTVAEPIGFLTTPWRAEATTSVGLELVVANRADCQRLASVTRIVTYGVCAHAATACARPPARASSRRS
jgi:hypothetical protein